MLEHNATLTHLTLMCETSVSTIECIVSNLRSLVDLRIKREYKRC